MANAISLQQLKEAMRLGKLGEQVVLRSRKAFDRIRFVEAVPADADVYYSKKVSRDKAAQMEYRRRVRKQPGNDELLMVDIMRGGIKNGDERLL